MYKQTVFHLPHMIPLRHTGLLDNRTLRTTSVSFRTVGGVHVRLALPLDVIAVKSSVYTLDNFGLEGMASSGTAHTLEMGDGGTPTSVGHLTLYIHKVNKTDKTLIRSIVILHVYNCSYSLKYNHSLFQSYVHVSFSIQYIALLGVRCCIQCKLLLIVHNRCTSTFLLGPQAVY